MWPPTQDELRVGCCQLLRMIHGDGCSPDRCDLGKLRQAYPTVRHLAYKLWQYRLAYDGLGVEVSRDGAVADWLMAERVWRGDVPLITLSESVDFGANVVHVADVEPSLTDSFKSFKKLPFGVVDGWPGTHWLDTAAKRACPPPDSAIYAVLKARVDAATIAPMPSGYLERRKKTTTLTAADVAYEQSLAANAAARHELYARYEEPLALHRAARWRDSYKE